MEGGATRELNFTLARSAVERAPIDVVVGSRGRHTAPEELADPVDVCDANDMLYTRVEVILGW